MTRIPFGEPGMAGNQNEVFTYQQLITGNAPTRTTAEVVEASLYASADFPQFSVVGKNAAGELVMAVIDEVTPANSIVPVGITTATIKAGSSVGNVAIWRDGCFNPDALNWDASYDTDAKKKAAFEGSTNVAIDIRKPGFAEGL